jgi:guanyl-specific ribonuclease Sa
LSLNLYTYVESNPLRYIDPSGMSPNDIITHDSPGTGTYENGIQLMNMVWKYTDSQAERAALWFVFHASFISIPNNYFDDYGGVGGNKSVGKEIKGLGNSIKSVKLTSLPKDAQTMYKKYVENGWRGSVSGQTPGTAAGSKYKNRDGKLPTSDNSGKPITYKEFDINNKLPNQNRDSQRFVRGSDGSVYYTDDHYTTFTKIK